MPRAGETFWDRAPESPVEHLYVVLTDPNADGNVLVANITKYNQLSKPNLDIPARQDILNCGWQTTFRSTIYPGSIALVDAASLDSHIGTPEARPSTMRPEWLARIRKAVCTLTKQCSAEAIQVISDHYDRWK
jgi:hypothetical protein